MLEVLDPEQNKNFGDHYIEVEYDLSKVMFIMTEIGKQYLLEKLIKNNGLDELRINVQRENDKVMLSISGYTKEAGVREFERLLIQFARKLPLIVVKKNKKVRSLISLRMLPKYLRT